MTWLKLKREKSARRKGKMMKRKKSRKKEVGVRAELEEIAAERKLLLEGNRGLVRAIVKSAEGLAVAVGIDGIGTEKAAAGLAVGTTRVGEIVGMRPRGEVGPPKNRK